MHPGALLIVQALKKKHRLGCSPFIPSVNNLGAPQTLKLESAVSPASWGQSRAGSPIPKTLYQAVDKSQDASALPHGQYVSPAAFSSSPQAL